jgi:DNA-binding NarL/FixJ family response regulator
MGLRLPRVIEAAVVPTALLLQRHAVVIRRGEQGMGTGTSPERDLSERELEIIELVAQGLTNQEIASALTISKRTVDNHVSNIFTKTGAKNRVALLNWAMDHGKICRDGFNCCALEDSAQAGSGHGGETGRFG